MAKFNLDFQENANSRMALSERNNHNSQEQEVRELYDEGVITSSQNVKRGDTIKVGTLPPNSRLLGITVTHSSLGATGATLSLGTDGDGTRFADAESVVSKGFITATNIGTSGTGDDEINTGIGETFAEATGVYLTVGGANATNKLAGSIRSVVTYCNNI